MYKLICMAFDGDYITERPEFETVDQVWDYADDLGSKWFFYPFCFVVSESGKTVIDSPYLLQHFNGKRLQTVIKQFKELSVIPDMEGADTEQFTLELHLNNLICNEI